MILLLRCGTAMRADTGATAAVRSATGWLGFVTPGKTANNGHGKHHPRKVAHWFSPLQLFWLSRGVNRPTAPRLRAKTGQRRISSSTDAISRMRAQQR